MKDISTLSSNLQNADLRAREENLRAREEDYGAAVRHSQHAKDRLWRAASGARRLRG